MLASLSLMMADQSSAATLRYRTSGAWGDVTDGSTTNGWGLSNGNAPGNVPVGVDVARANWGGNTVTLDNTAPTFQRLEIGVDESGTVEVNANGVLTTTQDVRAGNNNANATGTLTVNSGGIVNVGRILWAARNDSGGVINVNSGGTVNVASHLWWGSTGAAVINISGTIQQNGGILGLGTSNASTAGGGTAQVNILDGGLLALNNINGAGTSIFAGSGIDITGSGQLTLPNDFVNVLTTYANNGFIGGNGVPGLSNLQIDLTTNPGFTTVSVAPIPEPSVSVLLGLCGAGLALRRRRRA